MSSEAFAIRVTDVTKRYMMYARPEDRLKQSVVPRLERLIGRPPTKFYKDFDALHGVSFEVGRGETVGIIGRNGSGKSTLLQVICGTLTPTSGTVEVRGRIAALLELGAGFNPEFSGRENVYMNAAILGLSREETHSRFEAITKFADIGDFLEHPVKTYSSGMFVRLAFAVAVNVDPDILVVDEALSVGDEAFQRKCFARIEQIKDRGATILFVSHGAQTIVQLCDRAILMDAGEKLLDGAPRHLINHYQRLINSSEEAAPKVRSAIIESRLTSGEVTGSPATPTVVPVVDEFNPDLTSESIAFLEERGVRIHDIELRNLSGSQANLLARGKRYVFTYKILALENVSNIDVGMSVRSTTGLTLCGATSHGTTELSVRNYYAGQLVSISFEFDCRMLPGIFFLGCSVFGSSTSHEGILHRVTDAVLVRVCGEPGLLAKGYFDINPLLKVEQ